MPDPDAARGESSLDIQAAFDAVALTPAGEGSSARSSGSAPGLQVENGGTGTPGVSPESSGSTRRDGPDLKLESNSAAVTSRTQEGRPARASRSEESKPAPKESAKESAKESVKDAAKDSAKDSGSNAGKLRMTVDGEHLYAEIKGGKIVLKDRTYDSLAHARDSIRRERNKVAVWEYFDEGVKAWRVLNRD